jgi:hypothetical protein
MHLFFLDESGTPPAPTGHWDKYFVIGGLVIPDGVWHKVRDSLHGMKVRRKLIGELKWRYFTAHNNEDANPMKGLIQAQRNEIREEIYQIICSTKSIKSMACIACIETAYNMACITSSDDLYHYTYKPLSERFQYYLQDLSKIVGRTETGIIVADHRGAKQDARFRGAHERLLRTDAAFTSNYQNLVESLFFLPSDISVGVQLADKVAGAVWRKFEKSDDYCYKLLEPSLRKSPAGNVDGFGIMKFPKGTWK